jgi:hypothetical protein
MRSGVQLKPDYILVRRSECGDVQIAAQPRQEDSTPNTSRIPWRSRDSLLCQGNREQT